MDIFNSYPFSLLLLLYLYVFLTHFWLDSFKVYFPLTEEQMLRFEFLGVVSCMTDASHASTL